MLGSGGQHQGGKWEGREGTLGQVVLRTTGRLSEWDALDPTWISWEQSLSREDVHPTLLGFLRHIRVYSSQLTGVLFVPRNGFMLRKSQ